MIVYVTTAAIPSRATNNSAALHSASAVRSTTLLRKIMENH